MTRVEDGGGLSFPAPRQRGEHRRDRRVVLSAAAIVAVLLVAGGVLVGVIGTAGGPDDADTVRSMVERYLAAWAGGDDDALRPFVSEPSPELDAAYAGFRQELQVRSARFELGAVRVADDEASASFTAELELAGLGGWTYDGRLRLVRAELRGDAGEEREWLVDWEPAALHPALREGLRLGRVRTWPPRAQLLGVGGTPLSGGGAPALAALGAQLLGRVGPADEARIAELGDPYVEGDVAGLSGLQAAFEARLAGRPSGEVQLLDGENPVEVLARFAGFPPEPVQITVDANVQAAAERSLQGARQPAALVAMTASTGEVRAVVSGPVGGYNRALTGQYPPGSTFKVVTTAALLGNGVTPDTSASCPLTARIGGFTFSNAEKEELGEISFRTAFFRSCNTAFVQLASVLDPGALVGAAEAFGFNRELDLPVPAAGGSFPEPSDPVEKAAAAIGQGRVIASPLQMASVAATVASGAYRPPLLVAPPDVGPVASLDPGVAATLRELMGLVVRQGTGTKAALAGPPVSGKTGTAEFGTRRPPRTHAWFIGFRGDMAFAVLVEDGGFGGAVAAPLARDFLTQLES